MAALLLLVALLLFPLESQCCGHVKDLYPIVLVPAYASSRIEARLTESYEPSVPRCGARKGRKGWFDLWPNHTAFHDSRYVPCFAEQMSVVYDAVADDYRNVAGVVTRVPYFGSTAGFIGWGAFVRRLEGIGYHEGGNLFGAPYDFRYTVAPRGFPSRVGARYFRRLRRLIERASHLNDGKPAILLANSLGCALTYHFLLDQPLLWRRKHVKHVLFVGAALGGFVQGMDDLASGDSYGLPEAAKPSLKWMTRSQQTTLWRLPTPIVFGDKPLVVTKDRNYSAYDIPEFLDAIGFGEAVRPYETRVLPLWQALPAPMVPVTVIIGVGVRTPERFVYADDGLDGPTEVVYGDGDGSINLASLLAIEQEWAAVDAQALRVVRLAGVSHGELLSICFAIDRVVAELCKANVILTETMAKFSL